MDGAVVLLTRWQFCLTKKLVEGIKERDEP
jgi:hypothetical protein